LIKKNKNFNTAAIYLFDVENNELNVKYCNELKPDHIYCNDVLLIL